MTDTRPKESLGGYIIRFESHDSFLDDEQFNLLNNDIQIKLKRYAFLGGISILSSSGDQPYLIAKNDIIVEDYEIIKSTIASMQPLQFFLGLEDEIVRDNLGHLQFDYFEIYFAKLFEQFSVAFFVIDRDEHLIERLNSCLTSFQHAIAIPSNKQ